MPSPLDILRKHWGYAGFRPGQAEIVDAVVAGRDTLALLPTGGGKSICFQVPGLARGGVTIVISPLIALMKDQVRQLKMRGIIAEAIYSGLRKSDIDRILDNAVYGNTEFLYMSPERLLTELARVRIAKMNVTLFAVDEAHCISQWGYDFRPPYLRIAEIRELHPEVPVIAVTATATPEVVEDIETHLNFGKDKFRFQRSFGRDNLNYVVRAADSKENQLLRVLEGVPGTSIVYVRNRGFTKKIAHELQRRGIPAAAYHAGLEPKEKDRRQEAWIQGRLRVMVATNAFGMGIDKADVRSVIHYAPPDSPEAYFQEAGRGGRDGKTAYGVMLFAEFDAEILQRQWEAAYPPIAEIKRTYRALGSYLQLAVGGGLGETYDFDLAAFAGRFGFEVRTAYSSLKALERAGYILLTDDLHQAARIKFTLAKERLYDYQLKNRGTDKLVKSILRTTTGAFLDPVRIDEGNLANFLKIPLEQLQRVFAKMASDRVIDYFPAKDGPQLVFTTERLSADNLSIDVKQYNFLRDQAKHRIDTMITYAKMDAGCRNQFLLRYFGENDAPECGVCDLCRRRAANIKRQLTPKKVYADVRDQLAKHREMNVEDVVTRYGPSQKVETERIVQRLLNDGLLRRDGDKIVEG